MEQLPMTFSSPQKAVSQPLWLGLALDHRTLFEALQDEWMRPAQSTSGLLLGVRAFARFRDQLNGAGDNRIFVHLRLDPARLPRVNVLVKRGGRWIPSSITEVQDADEAVLLPGVMPTFAISDVLVKTKDEQMRLLGIARQVSNVMVPHVSLGVETDNIVFVDSEAIPPIDSVGIELSPVMDAIRGATAMATWAVPRIGPWVDILTASLGALPSLPKLVDAVGAPWLAHPVWAHPTDSGASDRESSLWRSAIEVIRERCFGEAIGSSDFVHDLVSRAITRSPGDASFFSSWAEETIKLLRAQATIRPAEWKAAPVGKAIQLVLTRPEPTTFKTWYDDLPTLPPAIWWSAAGLCGLLHGYRKLDTQFRGEPQQRQMLAIHAWRISRNSLSPDFWPERQIAPPQWRRDSDHQIILSWDGKDFAKKPEQARGRWYTANLDDTNVRRVAEDMVRRLGWPCLQRELVVSNEDLKISGEGSVEVTQKPERKLSIRGPLRIKIPKNHSFEETLDVEGFRRCLATEGAANLPYPPGKGQRFVSRHSQKIPGLMLVRDFLSEAEELQLVEIIDKGEWRSDLQRRVQHYGWRYDYKAKRVDASMKLGELPCWAERLANRLAAEGLVSHVPDQVIVNEYVGKQGISWHVDCVPCFADGIATISLLESWEMNFKESGGAKRKATELLERRSAVILNGEARFKWSHEIPKRMTEPNGSTRRRRISVTLRKVLQSASEPSRIRRK